MMIIFMLSIGVIACGIKVFSVLTSQLNIILNSKAQPILTSYQKKLKKVSYTLVAIGNAFAAVAGILSSLSVIIPVFMVLVSQGDWFTGANLWGWIGHCINFCILRISN